MREFSKRHAALGLNFMSAPCYPVGLRGPAHSSLPPESRLLPVEITMKILDQRYGSFLIEMDEGGDTTLFIKSTYFCVNIYRH